jgi:hypothetical protein
VHAQDDGVPDNADPKAADRAWAGEAYVRDADALRVWRGFARLKYASTYAFVREATRKWHTVYDKPVRALLTLKWPDGDHPQWARVCAALALPQNGVVEGPIATLLCEYSDWVFCTGAPLDHLGLSRHPVHCYFDHEAGAGVWLSAAAQRIACGCFDRGHGTATSDREIRERLGDDDDRRPNLRFEPRDRAGSLCALTDYRAEHPYRAAKKSAPAVRCFALRARTRGSRFLTNDRPLEWDDEPVREP